MNPNEIKKYFKENSNVSISDNFHNLKIQGNSLPKIILGFILSRTILIGAIIFAIICIILILNMDTKSNSIKPIEEELRFPTYEELLEDKYTRDEFEQCMAQKGMQNEIINSRNISRCTNPDCKDIINLIEAFKENNKDKCNNINDKFYTELCNFMDIKNITECRNMKNPTIVEEMSKSNWDKMCGIVFSNENKISKIDEETKLANSIAGLFRTISFNEECVNNYEVTDEICYAYRNQEMDIEIFKRDCMAPLILFTKNKIIDKSFCEDEEIIKKFEFVKEDCLNGIAINTAILKYDPSECNKITDRETILHCITTVNNYKNNRMSEIVKKQDLEACKRLGDLKEQCIMEINREIEESILNKAIIGKENCSEISIEGLFESCKSIEENNFERCKSIEDDYDKKQCLFYFAEKIGNSACNEFNKTSLIEKCIKLK